MRVASTPGRHQSGGVKPLHLALIPLGLVGLALFGSSGRYAAYRGNRFRCEPAGEAALVHLGAGLPDGVTVCGKEGKRALRLLVETPPAVCMSTYGLAGCPSAKQKLLAFVTAMAREGWDSGVLDVKGDFADASFVRGPERARLHLYQSPYGEISGTLEIGR